MYSVLLKVTICFQLAEYCSGESVCYFSYELQSNSCLCFQCTNGHLACAGCLAHLLADARLKDETPTCPNCRCEISRSNCIRNLAVEKAISELPSACVYCSQQLPRCNLAAHVQDQCLERYVGLR